MNTPNLPAHFFESLYSKANILYFVLQPSGLIRSCNVTVEDVLGYEKDQLPNTSFFEMVLNRNRKHFEGLLQICLTRGFIKDDYLSLYTINGEVKYFRINGLTSFDENGKVESIALYLLDETRLFKLEKQNQFSSYIIDFENKLPENDVEFHEFLTSLKEIVHCDEVGFYIRSGNDETRVQGSWMYSSAASSYDEYPFGSWAFEDVHKLYQQLLMQQEFTYTVDRCIVVQALSELKNEINIPDINHFLYCLKEYESMILIPHYTLHEINGFYLFLDTGKYKWSVDEVTTYSRNLKLLSKKEASPSQLSAKDVFQLFEKMPQVGVMLTKDGIVEASSTWILSYLKYNKDELIQKKFSDLVPIEYQDVIFSLPEESQHEQHFTNIAMLNSQGKRKLMQCTVLSLPQGEGKVVVWFFIDKEPERLLKRQLLQTRKIEALGMLAAGIVHDFKNLLSGIEGYSSLLCEDIPTESPYYEDVQQIGAIAEKAIHQTSRLLAYSEGGKYVVNDLDLNEIIKEVATMMSRMVHKNIAIRAELDENLYTLKADASQMQYMLLQLALNSRDAMPEGGKMIFQSKNINLTEKDPRLKNGSLPGEYIQLTISDTGYGMSNSIKEHMFDSFFTTKDEVGGKGLGLNMIRDIIESHKGFYSIFSENKRGTVFKVFFPIQDIQKNHDESDVNNKIPLGKENILLVDDEKVLRETARKMLTRYGYKVISVNSGIKAVSVFKKNTLRIDLILFDLSMPDLDVNKIFATFKKMNPDVKIIITSQSGERNQADSRAMKYISGHIEKPFKVRPLLNKIRTYLNS